MTELVMQGFVKGSGDSIKIMKVADPDRAYTVIYRVYFNSRLTYEVDTPKEAYARAEALGWEYQTDRT